VRDYRELVVSNPGVMMGKPVIAGIRITLVESHPILTEDAVRATLAFAADALRADVVYPLEAIHR
jgi:uncharacterized protein (DUF433 family)